MSLLASLPDEFDLHLKHTILQSRFNHFVSGDEWTSLQADSGSSVSAVDAAGGGLNLVSGGTDNFEAYVHSTQELFLFADDKPAILQARLAFAEANTDDINVLVGWMSAVVVNSLIDDAGGPLASYSGAVFFKLDGGTVWNFETSIGGTQETTALAALSPTGATDFHTLRIEAHRRDATTVEIIPKIDEGGGNGLKQALDADGKKIKHTITLGSPTEMAAVCGVKSGGANAETVRLQLLDAIQLR